MHQRRRLWLEAAAAVVASLAALATILAPDWIEVVFGVEPDGGAGWLEVGITATLIVAAVGLAVVACAELRRRTAIAY